MKRMGILLLLVVCGPRVALCQDLTLARLWPNANGTQWTYLQTYADDQRMQESTVRMLFQGAISVPSGPVVQNLVEMQLSGTAKPRGGAPANVRDPFMRQVWVARPDLRAAIERRASERVVASPTQFFATVLLFGAAWERTNDVIRAWRTNTDNLVAWIWLVSDLTVGTEFQLQLIPDFANDVFLYGRIAAVEDVSVPADNYTGALRVDYRIDYGVSECVDTDGMPIGSFRSETTGSIHYVADVGPVRVLEQFVAVSEQISGDCGLGEVGHVSSTTRLELLATDTVGVEHVSWTDIKALYHD